MFSKIIIANRGEIACRVIRTAKRLGIKTVAVYSDVDKKALHVELADEAVYLGPAPASESYLRGDKIIHAAKTTGAEAIHPGYGFLSENAAFAKSCAQADIVFIGPPVSAIEAMGSKSAAKTIMQQAKVPLVPGYHGDQQGASFLETEAEKIGFPVLIKASAGGGGKGMRVVRNIKEFSLALEAAKREAISAFDDDHVLLEKYLLKPRHIEFQVFADNHGNAVHLFERDCSVQRRHQKVIEEAPAPGMHEDKRESMGQAAVEAARAINYRGAGTVEFIVDSQGNYYFMEMNTRLQVEHPVTEMITGQDLVEWQFRVAANEKIPLQQAELKINGHALEARLYAEDPENDFLPAVGKLERLYFPESNDCRFETGVREGDEVSIYYDPMIAKVVCWAPDRATALTKLASTLATTQLVGLANNLVFARRVISHSHFQQGGVDTGFIETHREDLFAQNNSPDEQVLIAAALYSLLQSAAVAEKHAKQSGDANSPWHSTDGFCLNAEGYYCFEFLVRGHSQRVTIHFRKPSLVFEISGKYFAVEGSLNSSGRDIHLTIDGVSNRLGICAIGRSITVIRDGENYLLESHDSAMADTADDFSAAHLRAPMPGKVIAVNVTVGAQVKFGDALLVLEAMKMEHTIVAQKNGEVEEVFFAVGDLVDAGEELVALT